MNPIFDGVNDNFKRYFNILLGSELFQKRTRDLTEKPVILEVVHEFMNDFFLPITKDNGVFVTAYLMTPFYSHKYRLHYADIVPSVIKITVPSVAMLIEEKMTYREWCAAYKSINKTLKDPQANVLYSYDSLKKSYHVPKPYANIDLLLKIYALKKIKGWSDLRIKDQLVKEGIRARSRKGRTPEMYSTDDVRNMFYEIRDLIDCI